MAAPPTEGKKGQSWGVMGKLAASAAGAVLLAVGGYWVLYLLGPDDPNLGDDPGVVEAVFNARWVIGGARLALISGLVYLVYSVGELISSRRPAEQIGAVKAGDPVQDAAETVVKEGRGLEDVVRSQQDEITRLNEWLDDALEELDELQTDDRR